MEVLDTLLEVAFNVLRAAPVAWFANGRRGKTD